MTAKNITEVLVVTLMFSNVCLATQIFDGWYADPQIRRYGDTYWIFPTTSIRPKRQFSFDAFSSQDMKTWTKHAKILTTKEVNWAKGAMWAPDAHEVDGKYYLFFSANDPHPVDIKGGDMTPQTEAKMHGYGGIGVAASPAARLSLKDCKRRIERVAPL